MKMFYITHVRLATRFRGRIDAIAKVAYQCKMPPRFIGSLQVLRRSNFCSAFSFKPLPAEDTLPKIGLPP
jgi:hypothetical protein